MNTANVEEEENLYSEYSSLTVSEKIQKLQSEYYEQNRKNIFFKKLQKANCAEMISTRMDLADLINETVWIIPNTNGVVIDYTVFKTYATADNYEKIIDAIILRFNECIEYFDEYNIFMNILGFTVSSAERYKSVVELFYTKCFMQGKYQYLMEKLRYMKILNAPNVMDSISAIYNTIISPTIKPKIQIYKKAESTEIMNRIMSLR